MVSGKVVSNVVGGKTARACDGCVRKRARWYCAADDVFLCQACDSSVHSANPLARTHERVRLKTASSKVFHIAPLEIPIPSWLGVTKKARTPRQGKSMSNQTHNSELTFPLVPELNFDENSHDELEDQLLYRVPTYHPFPATLCNSTTNSNEVVAETATTSFANEAPSASVNNNNEIESGASVFDGFCCDDSLQGFLPSDMDLAEFAADVESLLGRGLENESFGIEELGLIDCKDDSSLRECSLGSELRVKIENEGGQLDMDMDLTRESLELNFDYNSPMACEEEDEKVMLRMMDMDFNDEDEKKTRKRKESKLLRLDYEAIISAWGDNQLSPWATGTRPDIDECWPEFMVNCGAEVYYGGPYGETSNLVTNATMRDGAREARVSRYREKRRTRLFSKKIRYEVRKLNAEKRPRMKGRFVKRSSFALPPFPLFGKS